jgi:hypothetical protein
MSVPLQYDISIIGDDRLKRVMRSVEQEAARSSKRADSSFSKIGTSRAALVDKEQRARASAEAALQRQRSSALTREYNERLRAERRAQAEKERGIKRAEQLEQRANERAAKARQQMYSRLGGSTAASVKAGAGKVIGLAGTALAFGGGILGGIGAAGAVQNRIDAHASAAALANQAVGNPGETRSREQIKADIMAQSASIDRRTGAGEGNVVEGVRRFTAISGNLAGGQKLAEFITQLSDAVDAGIGDLGEAAGRIDQALQLNGVDDANERLRQTKDILATIAQQSKIGSVEMSDYAQHISQITSAAGRFGGASAESLIKFMSAVGQLSAGSGGDAAEAATAVARLPDDIIKHLGVLEKNGISAKDIYTDPEKKTTLKAAPELMMAILKRTGGNLEKVSDIFDIRAQRAFEPLRKIFTTAEAKKKGSGENAVNNAIAPYLNASLTPQEIAKGAAFRESSQDRQIARAMGEFNRQIGERLLPVVNEMIPKFTEMIPAIGTVTGALVNFAGWIAENPWQGLGALIGAFIVKDLAGAGIGAMVTSVLRSLMTGGAPIAGQALTALGGAAAGSAVGVGLAAGGAVLGTGLAAYQGYQAFSEVSDAGRVTDASGKTKDGGFLSGLASILSGPARATSREQYEAIHGPQIRAREAAAATGDTAKVDASGASKELERAAARTGDIIADKLGRVAMVSPSRVNPVVAR